MSNLFHLSLKRTALTFKILPILFLCTVSGGQPNKPLHQHALWMARGAMVTIHNWSRKPYDTEPQTSALGKANFQKSKDGLPNWASVFAHSPTLEPSTLFLIGIGLVGLAAWGRSHPPTIKNNEAKRANGIQVLTAQTDLPNVANSDDFIVGYIRGQSRSKPNEDLSTRLDLH